MKHRPWLIKCVASSLFIVPITTIFYVYTSARETGVPTTATAILDLWVLGITASVTALGIWRVRPWGFFGFFAFVIGVVCSDLFRIATKGGPLSSLDYGYALTAAVCIVFVFQKHVTAPYFNPSIRWWETASRHKTDLQGTIALSGNAVPAQVLDVSVTGCFVALDLPHISRGQVFSIGLTLNHFYFESPVKVIRHSAHPKGIGLMFVDTSKENRREIRRMIKDLSRSDSKQDSVLAS